jgi:hypothetical protein
MLGAVKRRIGNPDRANQVQVAGADFASEGGPPGASLWSDIL